MFDDFADEALLQYCGIAYNDVCRHYAVKDRIYKNSLKELLDIVVELMRRAKK